jgi:hypothetical protein
MTLTRAEGENLSLILSRVDDKNISPEFISGLTERNDVSKLIEALRELISEIGIRENDLILDSLSCDCGGKLRNVGETAAGRTLVLCCETDGCERIYHIDFEGEEMRLNSDTFRGYTE